MNDNCILEQYCEDCVHWILDPGVDEYVCEVCFSVTEPDQICSIGKYEALEDKGQET